MNRYLWFLVITLPGAILVGCSGGRSGGSGNDRSLRVGFMPKLVGIPYFNACKRGAEQAAEELQIELTYNGPNEADANRQNDLLNEWVHSGEFDCICVACNDPDLVAPILKEARKEGILVVTYDADSQPDARDFFVNQATYADVAHAMVDALAEDLEPRGTGKVAILTSYVNAPNQSQWARRIKEYVQSRYPRMQLLPEVEHGEDRNLGITKAKALIEATPDLKGILGLTSVAVPAAAEAVRQEGKKGQIKVAGVSTPKDMSDYVKDGTVKTVVLWNPVDLGYLTVHVAALLKKGQMPTNGTIDAGRLKGIAVHDREVLLGKPLRFTRDNIDQYDF
jgi:ABC-type sugar transport system substrate-binding protein